MQQTKQRGAMSWVGDVAVIFGKDLRAELRHHLRHGELLVLQLDARNFFAALENGLEDAHEVDERDH